MSSKRASTFTYLYRILRLDTAKEVARADLEAVWDPDNEPQWVKLIEQAEARASTDVQ